MGRAGIPQEEATLYLGTCREGYSRELVLIRYLENTWCGYKMLWWYMWVPKRG